ncbi:MAG: hypothetical protein AAF485_10475, partial [Chloroflexota bacterium]
AEADAAEADAAKAEAIADTEVAEAEAAEADAVADKEVAEAEAAETKAAEADAEADKEVAEAEAAEADAAEAAEIAEQEVAEAEAAQAEADEATMEEIRTELESILSATELATFEQQVTSNLGRVSDSYNSLQGMANGLVRAASNYDGHIERYASLEAQYLDQGNEAAAANMRNLVERFEGYQEKFNLQVDYIQALGAENGIDVYTVTDRNEQTPAIDDPQEAQAVQASVQESWGQLETMLTESEMASFDRQMSSTLERDLQTTSRNDLQNLANQWSDQAEDPNRSDAERESLEAKVEYVQALGEAYGIRVYDLTDRNAQVPAIDDPEEAAATQATITESWNHLETALTESQLTSLDQKVDQMLKLNLVNENGTYLQGMTSSLVGQMSGEESRIASYQNAMESHLKYGNEAGAENFRNLIEQCEAKHETLQAQIDYVQAIGAAYGIEVEAKGW